MLPTGRVTLEEVRATLSEQRRRALAVLDMRPDAAVHLHTIRMTVLGPDARLDAHEFLTFIALHVERHAAQVHRIVLALAASAS
jgi:hypothetical protein